MTAPNPQADARVRHKNESDVLTLARFLMERWYDGRSVKIREKGGWESREFRLTHEEEEWARGILATADTLR